jgi:peptide-methionine (S)-S-oxide reductase
VSPFRPEVRVRAAFVPLIVVGGLIAFGAILTFFQHQEFTVPENFPVLDPAEIASASALAPVRTNDTEVAHEYSHAGVKVSANAPARTGDTELATFGSGCFWCTEAVFQQIKGVRSVVSGYSGGHVKNPTYEQVCDGDTGHAEVVQVTFDPKVVSYPELLEVFWRSHDPTTKNRQRNDSGPQYRSVVFYHSEEQKRLAELYKKKIDAAQVYRDPLVTEIAPYTEFFPATADHQNFYATNPRQGYCRVVIGPKVEKLRKVFADKLKKE